MKIPQIQLVLDSVQGQFCRFSEVDFNVPNLMKSTVVVCLKISTLSTSYRILTCPTRGAVANNSSLFSDIFARQP